jgi:hypothetical protein
MRVLATFVLFVFLAGSSFCQAKKEYYTDYLIPDGYVGYVRAAQEVEDAPSLPVENGRTVFKFDKSGWLKTSDKVQEGWIYPKYYYYNTNSKELLPYTARGGGGMIWDGTIAATTILEFFVGTEAQKSLWYQSDCGKEKDRFGYLPQNIKQCLDDYEKSKATKK